MKHTLLALALTLTSASALAATTATLLLKGVVPAVLSISVTAESVAANLPLNTTQNNTKIATVNEKSNAANGYKVTISSQNQGKLVRSGGNQQFPYTLNYNNQTINLSSQAVLNNSGNTATSVNRDLKISYTGQSEESMVAGDYVDTITFSIAAN